MTRRHNYGAGIAGLSLLACAAMVAMAGVMQAFREYAQEFSAFLLWLVADARFGIGMLFMAVLFAGVLACAAWSDRA